jgi:hypothetical protein
MNTILSVALIVLGILFIIFGVRSMDSFSADFSRFVTALPTHRAMLLFVGGLALVILGILLQYTLR